MGQAHRLSTTVDELVQLARTGRAGRGIDVDLTMLLGTHVDDWRPAYLAAERRLTLVVEARPIVHITPGVVGQTIDVLLANALEHGGGAVEVRLARRGDFAEFTVADGGGGVAPDRVPLLFTPIGPAVNGRGIGLPLARELIEGEGGRLTLERAVPALFRCALPAAVDGPDTAGEAAGAARAH